MRFSNFLKKVLFPLIFQFCCVVGITHAEINSNVIEKVVLDNLMVPWEIAFLPDGTMLVTERSGMLLVYKDDKLVRIKIEEVASIGEGGLLGLAVHPNFSKNKWIYLYRTTLKNKLTYVNQVVRFKLENNQVTNFKLIVDNIPAGARHNGGRIKFGPDGNLYITTGDAGYEDLAQDKNSLAGKILRVTDEGQVPLTNPFHNLVYSYGHRNGQGLVWDEEGNLYETEHGPIANDKINLIKMGQNYGWPVVKNDEKREGFVLPVLSSGKDETWAPAGIAFWQGHFYFGGLRGSALYEIQFINKEPKLIKHYHKKFGRIRAITVGPDKALYISTSNKDGRGLAREGDDKIIRLSK